MTTPSKRRGFEAPPAGERPALDYSSEWYFQTAKKPCHLAQNLNLRKTKTEPVEGFFCGTV